VVLRICVPAINVLSVVVATNALIARTRTHFRKTRRFHDRLIIFSLTMSILGSILRAVYCIAGPVLSNGFFSYEQHVWIGLPGKNLMTQILCIVANASLFQRLGQMTQVTQRKMDYVAIFIVFVMFSLSISRDLLLSKGMDSRVTSVNQILILSYVVFASAYFLVYGLKILQGLHGLRGLQKFSGHSHEGKRSDDVQEAAKRRITVWITLSGIIMLM
jgi:hypothetical protein